jgi:hypothetical protein
MDAQADAAVQTVVGQKAPSEVGDPVSLLGLDFERGAWTRREEERRGRGSRADAAKPTSQRAAKIKNPEVKACRRLDEDGLSVDLRHHA